jgi:hypothetical protein
MMKFTPYFGLMVLLTIVGCSEKLPDGMPKLIKVSLTFKQEGKPLSGATVSLVSEDPAIKWTVGGSTNNNGVVILKTHGIYTGVPEGEYKICVKKFVMEGELQTMANPGAPPPRDYNLVESQYGYPDDTPLAIEIKSGSKYEPFDVGKAVKELVKAPGM